MGTVYETIQQQADAMAGRLQAVRRDLHTYPEPGWCEIRTASLVAQRLTELGYQVLLGQEVCLADARMGLPSDAQLEEAYQRALEQGAVQPYAQHLRNGFTGVIGLLDCGEGPTVALRFDIDALGVYEEESPAHRPSREGFRSVNAGVMHACGHDGHTAMGLGVAEILMNCRKALKGRVKLIFQPAEEGVRGANSIVAHGHLDDVDYVIGNHITNGGGDGSQIALTYGATLATTKMDILFTGKPAHAGAAPEAGANALLAASTAVLNLHAIPRSGQGDTRVNVGTLVAGTGRNVICDRAKMEVEVRGATTQANQFMESYARRIVQAAASMHGCTCSIQLMGTAGSLQSHPDMLRYCQKVCSEKLGLHVAPPKEAAGNSEDFSCMVDRVHSRGGKGLFFNTLTPCAGPAHSGIFDFEEGALCTGVKAFCALTYSLLREERP